MSKTPKFFLLLIALLGSDARAAIAPITLQGAFEAAEQKTEPIPSARSQTLQAEERVSQIVGRVLPAISLLGSYTRQHRPPSALNAFSQPDQYSARLNLVQPIFRGFGEWAELASRKALVRSQRALETQARVTLYGTVADSFFAVLTDEAERETLRTVHELIQKRVAELKGRVAIGRSRRGELLSAQSQAASVAAQIEAAEIQVAQSRETFALATGLPASTPLAAPQSPPPAVEPVEQWLARIESRPDIQSAAERATAASESIAVARAGHFPTIDFTANYWLKRTGILENTKWDFGVQLTVPLFQGGAISAGVTEAAERHKVEELAVARARREAARELVTLHTTVQRGEAQFRLLEVAAKEAERNYDEQNRDFRYALVTNLDVIAALNAYQDAKRARDRAWFSWLNAWARLQAAAGKLP